MFQGVLTGFIVYLEVKYRDQIRYQNLNWESWEKSILWIKDVGVCVYIHTHTHYGILLSYRNEWSNAIYHSKDGPRDAHTLWSDSDHTQIEKDKSHVVSLIPRSYKMIQMNLFTKTEIENKLMITKGEIREGIN